MIHKFRWVLAILLFCFGLEVVGGYFFGALSLYSDALHVFSDMFAVGIAFSAILISQKKLPSSRMSYGYHRLEVFSAIFNGAMLIILAMLIFFAALKRIQSPQEVMALPALIVGIIGFIGNLAAATLLRLGGEHQRDLNIKAAYWHVLGDMLASVAVVIGMLMIALTGNNVIDPIVSMGIALILIFNALRVLKEGAGILLQQSPHDVSLIREKVCSIPHVLDIDDFRLWQVCSHLIIGTAHVITDVEKLNETDEIASKIKTLLDSQYNICHLTLQFETRQMYERHRHDLKHKH